ncbi:GmrSD restriction endonuclease domain-containing protein [Oceanimonas smirnovii]|uniref:GmrSD restriction endonuclease domain-containing protein n=1 Tax=Oceanimonas smirnovii TaxID=264574 RepID=UPI000377F616|nr:DUF262 domain-containing protein [Oceanimonas smirnovii]
MSQNQNMIAPLSVRELLEGKVHYLIPMYQRNYAWEEGEITQLIEDVLDVQPKNQRYYIGTLVVFRRAPRQHRPVFEVIDGQQRLTTLSLLMTYLRNLPATQALIHDWYRQPSIEFECREHSRQTFMGLFNGRLQGNPPTVIEVNEVNVAIENGYRIIHKVLEQKCRERDVTLTDFIHYLLDKVQILRVEVPKDTDLNYYFEVMNNRGEQLEKHEVLKARLLDVLSNIENADDKARSERTLHMVWEACANMEKYVQSGFNTDERTRLFGPDWNELTVGSFDALSLALEQEETVANSNILDIEAILSQPDGKPKQDRGEESPERFHSVINFPNFLLHVLRAMLAEDVPLDDKRLLESFDTFLLYADGENDNKAERVKQFIFALLRGKYLFDRFVIKREFIGEKDGWSLKQYHKNNSGNAYYLNTFNDEHNRQALMLLTAFHVSTPTLVYKHWLNAALHWLLHGPLPVQAEAYLTQLESVAKAFVFDRFLAESGLGYYAIIYQHQGDCQATKEAMDTGTMTRRLSYGEIENNLVFNYLDYLLWKKHKSSDSRINEFEFTFRSSVEHYYPQHPLPGFDTWDKDDLDSFGNLCLISHSKNSRLSNLMPEAKQSYYKHNKIDSIKQHLMMQGEWSTPRCDAHQQEMLGVLQDSLS